MAQDYDIQEQHDQENRDKTWNDNWSKVWKIGQIVFWLVMGGVAFGSMRTDFQGLERLVASGASDAKVSHEDHEKRLRSLEQDRETVKKDVEYIKQGIDEIKQEIRRSR